MSMQTRIAPFVVGLVIAVAAAAAGGYWLGVQQNAAGGAAQPERAVLYWYDPMVPDQHFDAPGKSPFMDMQLVPRYADEAGAGEGVRIDANVAQNLGVRFAVVESAPLTRSVLAAGVLAFNERNVAIVQARAGGFVERSHGRAIGDVVAAGAPIVDIRVPEWAAAQGEYLALRGAGGDFAAAARQRLLMLGMSEALIERIEQGGAAHAVFTVTAPIAGVITTLDARPGMAVTSGAPLAAINSVSPIWLVASIPQADASMARPGAQVAATLAAVPGEQFSGRIESVAPSASAATRSIEVRIALLNPRGRLRPGMSAEVRLEQRATQAVLLVPSEAVIRTGRRDLVIVALEGGRFAPVEVTLGRQSGDRIEIASGLQQGQRVVASGQFLIDSEASLSGVLVRLQSASPDAVHDASGRVTAISAQAITIAHGPVVSLNWPAMNMQFSFARAELASGVRVGDDVAFRFRQGDTGFVIQEINKTGGAP